MQPQLLLKDSILNKIKQKGGWVNAHAHFDRSFTVNPQNLEQAHQLMEKKWMLVDPMKKRSTEEDYFARIEKSVKSMIAQGARVCATFIDVDPVAELRAIRAAVAVKEKYAGDIRLFLINQVQSGLTGGLSRTWAEKALEYVDMVGATPSKDRPNAAAHIDTVLRWAKETGKMAHVHIDQENNPEEHDTELLVKKTLEHGMEGRVVAVHAISVGAQPAKKRKEIYVQMKAAGLSVVCCPSAALSMKSLSFTTQIHNSIAPVPELWEAGIPVALGCDNISDIFQPLVDGDMYTELRFLAEACRFYDIEKLVEIATINGRKALGME